MKDNVSVQPPDFLPGEEKDVLSERATRIIAITSGKGGVGKTNITTNLGIALASRGAQVCIFDADTSLANINILLGLTPQYTMEHLLSDEKTIDEIILEGPKGIKIIPAASGIVDCINLNEGKRLKLLQALRSLEDRFDYLLIDTAAGIGDNVLCFLRSAQYTVVVISPEPTSLTDAFALLRVVKQEAVKSPVYVLVNMALNYANSMEVFRRFAGAVQKYLQIEPHYLGYIAADEAMRNSVSMQHPVVLQNPEAPASRCFFTLAEGLEDQFTPSIKNSHSLSSFWEKLATAGSACTAQEHRSEVTTAIPLSGEERPPGLAAMLEDALNLLRDKSTSPAQAEAFLAPLIEVFIERHQRFPMDIYKSLYRLLEMRDFPANEIRDVVSTLGSLYESRYQHPLEPPRTEEKDRLLVQVREITGRLKVQETGLRKALTRLTKSVNDTISAREDYEDYINKDSMNGTDTSCNNNGQD